jgi:23S rRNA (guanosine2251-2'-O)-methyltransferase
MAPRHASHKARKDTRHHRRSQSHDDGPLSIYGIHAVEAALRNPRRVILRLMATQNAEHRLAEAIAHRGLAVEPVQIRELDRRLGPDTVHQGVLAEAEPLSDPTLAALAESSEQAGPLVVLDQVTDPHNVGAILRSAAVFGGSGLIMTRRHSPPLGGALAKSASGGLEAVPVALVGNLAQTLAELRKLHVQCIGLDGEAGAVLEDEPLTGPLAIVLGAEGKGLRQLTRESCDRLCRIRASGPLASLNVSNAAAVALHVAAMRRALSRG